MARIKTIEYDESDGSLKKIYDGIIKKRGKLADVHRIQSLNPESIVAHMDLYMTIMFGHSPLSRAQREMIAVVVSSVNQCAYCVRHHSEALNFYWKDTERIKALASDHTQIELTAPDKMLCEYARHLTLNPMRSTDEHISYLRDASVDDRAILDATLVTAYFNFVNRIVLGLGVDIESDDGKGYIF